MNYFIPSWYEDENSWNEKSQLWFRQENKFEFDDVVNYLRIFNKSGINNQLLLTSYFPGLRHYLHRQRLTGISVHSLFDDLQGIPDDFENIPLNYRDIDWPAGTDFVYNAFQIFIYQNGKMVQRLAQGIDGNIIYIEELNNSGQVKRKLLFDDRGFISRDDRLTPEGWKQDYLAPDGSVAFSVYPDDRVLVVDSQKSHTKQTIYNNLSELIQEKLAQYIKNITKNDMVFLSLDNFQSQILGKTLVNKEVEYVLSVFSNRLWVNNQLTQKLLNNAKLVLVDSDNNYSIVHELSNTKVLQIPTFDTRFKLGESNHESMDKILFLVDGLSEIERLNAMSEIIGTLEEHSNYELHLLSFKGENKQSELNNELLKLSSQLKVELPYVITDKPTMLSENQTNTDDNPRNRAVFYHIVNSELDMFSILKETRLVLNLGSNPNVYLQIAAISSGIPQILTTSSLYLNNNKNGKVIENISENLGTAIDYYLLNLRNWNDSQLEAVRLISEYTGAKMIDKLKKSLLENKNG